MGTVRQWAMGSRAWPLDCVHVACSGVRSYCVNPLSLVSAPLPLTILARHGLALKLTLCHEAGTCMNASHVILTDVTLSAHADTRICRTHARFLHPLGGRIWGASWRPATLQCPSLWGRCVPGLTQARLSYNSISFCTQCCMPCHFTESKAGQCYARMPVKPHGHQLLPSIPVALELSRALRTQRRRRLAACLQSAGDHGVHVHLVHKPGPHLGALRGAAGPTPARCLPWCT